MVATVPHRPDPELPDEAWLIALAALPDMGPARLGALLGRLGPAEAWRLVASGRAAALPALAERMGKQPDALAAEWRAAALRFDVDERWAMHSGVIVTAHGRTGYPEALADDLEPPAVLFAAGTFAALDGPRVAIVGTRRCTRYGFDVALDLGRDLAAAGVHVVSGLALGIDGAAHRGALDAAAVGGAAPVGVVASGLDVVYPKRHRTLWEQVRDTGVLLSECPLGVRPEAWRFPARNRIIAALAQAVVVVESPGAGGSMYTVEEALRRDVPVLAVPGSVRSPASAGTNNLINDGGQMVRDVADVLMAIGIDPPRRPVIDRREPPEADGRAVLDALGWEPATLEALGRRSGLAFGPLSLAVAELEAAGWIGRQGLWFERIGAPR